MAGPIRLDLGDDGIIQTFYRVVVWQGCGLAMFYSMTFISMFKLPSPIKQIIASFVELFSWSEPLISHRSPFGSHRPSFSSEKIEINGIGCSDFTESIYCDFHNYEYTEVQIPTCKTAFSLPSINDNQSVPLIFLTDGSENANSNGQLQRRCPRNNENRSK